MCVNSPLELEYRRCINIITVTSKCRCNVLLKRIRVFFFSTKIDSQLASNQQVVSCLGLSLCKIILPAAVQSLPKTGNENCIFVRLYDDFCETTFSKTVTTPDIINRVHNFFLSDRRLRL